MVCGGTILVRAIYCGPCDLLLCSNCFSICSSICPHKAYTAIPVNRIEQVDETTTLIKVKKPNLPEISNLQNDHEHEIQIVATPKMIIAEKTEEHVRFLYGRIIYEFKPFTIKQTWFREYNQYRLEQNILVKPKGNFTEPWHPHVRRHSGELCLGTGDEKIQRRASSEHLSEYIRTNFVVLESVLRDFGVLGHGYNNPQDCLGKWTVRLSPEVEKIRISMSDLVPIQTQPETPQISPRIRGRGSRRGLRRIRATRLSNISATGTTFPNTIIRKWERLSLESLMSQRNLRFTKIENSAFFTEREVRFEQRFERAITSSFIEVLESFQSLNVNVQDGTPTRIIPIGESITSEGILIGLPLDRLRGFERIMLKGDRYSLSEDIQQGIVHFTPETDVCLRLKARKGPVIAWVYPERNLVIIRNTIYKCTTEDIPFVKRVLSIAAQWYLWASYQRLLSEEREGIRSNITQS